MATPQDDLVEFDACRRIEFDSEDATLHDKHLLQIGNLALDRMVIMGGLDKTRLVREQAELQGRSLLGKEAAFPDGGARPYHFGKQGAVPFYSFISHRLSSSVEDHVPGAGPISRIT